MSTFWWVLGGLWVLAGLLAAIYWQALARARWSWLGVWLLGGIGLAVGQWGAAESEYGLPKVQCIGDQGYDHLELNVGRGKVRLEREGRPWHGEPGLQPSRQKPDPRENYTLPAGCRTGAALYRVKGNLAPSFETAAGVLRVAAGSVPGGEVDLLLVLPQGLELESFSARLGEVDLYLGLLAAQTRIEMARGTLTLSSYEETAGSIVARIGSGELDLGWRFAGEIRVEAGYLEALLTDEGEHGRIQAQTGDIIIYSTYSPENTRYRSSRAITTSRGDPKPRRVGAYYELGPEGAPALTIELERGSLRAY